VPDDTQSGRWKVIGDPPSAEAYYAVFHSFREWLRNHGLNVANGASAHSNLYLGLANCGVPAVALLAQRIDRIRSDRTDSDYDFSLVVNQMLAAKLVAAAEAVVADFHAILHSTPAQQIADGAKNYLISIGRIRKTP
jgi:uncharacterized protein (UPF0332 family)